MASTPYRHLFGPVNSRRMGRSLGVDLVPLKTCSFNCVFCQLGRTPLCAVERREYVPLREVLSELDDWLCADGQADFITLAGSGEPTLHTGFGRVLSALREISAIRTALLTNSSLMHLPEVRRDAVRAHVIKVSLSGWDQPSLERINRPHPAVRFDAIISGLRALRTEFSGELWLEVFVVPSLNDGEAELRRIADLARGFRPDRIHLNTAVRPAAEASVLAADRSLLEERAVLFEPHAEVVADVPAAAVGRGQRGGSRLRSAPEAALDMVTRHPATAVEVASALGMDVSDVETSLEMFVRQGRLRRIGAGGQVHYAAAEPGR